MTFSLAIVGRPNVGKSTLFNRLVGKKLALVDNQPGVTRDLREGQAQLGNLHFKVVDTAGLEDAVDESLEGRMRKLTESAVDTTDICLFLIDARVGVTSADEVLADILRKKARHLILVANKAEGQAAEAGVFEAWSLGLEEPLRLSAEHGEGMEDLLSVLTPLANLLAKRTIVEDVEIGAVTANESNTGSLHSSPTAAKPLQVAVIGRPNAGKSTLINKILGEDRLLTGPEAGLTRDAISFHINWNTIPMRFFDTAGMRKKAKVQEKLEKLSVGDGLRAVKFAEIVVVLMDASIPFEQQDLRIADLAEREGRGVVVAVNKWDLEARKQKKLDSLKESFARLLPQLNGAPLVALSAKTGHGLECLHRAILCAYEVWNKRLSTANLNVWLSEVIKVHPPPAPGGRRIKLRYITQVKTRPPCFVVMCSNPAKLPNGYKRYLVNGLRKHFNMPGTPIRLYTRCQSDKNPFKGRKKSSASKLKKHL